MWHPDSIYDASGHLDEAVLHAWLDGELETGDVREIESHTASCGICAARAAEARGLVAGARRVLGALDAQASVIPAIVGKSAPATQPASLVASRPFRARAPRRWTTRRVSLAAAAVLMFAAGSLVVNEQRERGLPPRRTTGAADASAAPETMPAAAPTAATVPMTVVRERERPAGAAVPQTGAAVAKAAPAAPRAALPPLAPPPAPPSPQPSPVAVAQEAPRRGADALEGRIGMVAGRSAPATGRVQLRGAVAGSAPVAAVAAAAPPDAASNRSDRPVDRSDRAADRSYRGTDRVEPTTAQSDSAVRRRIGQGSVQLDAVVVTGLGTASAEKTADRAPMISSDVKLAGCWRIGTSDSVLLLDTLPRRSRLIAGSRGPEPILWRRVDSVSVIGIRTAARGAADTTERVVLRQALVRVSCP